MPVNASESSLFALLSQRRANDPSIELSKKTISDFRAGVKIFDEFSGIAANIPAKNDRITVRDGYKVPIRIYNHHLKQKPVLIFYVANGYVADLFEINAIAASRIAYHSGIKVIVINTRLAPEYPLPTAIYDAYDVTRYIIEHTKLFNITNEITIGGVCSGAHCAAAISDMARSDPSIKIHHQILVNGYYDLTNSCLEFKAQEKEDKMLTREVLKYLSHNYYGIPPSEYANPLFSPYFEDDLSDLPKTTFLIGEYDGARGDSEAYYQKLVAVNNKVNKIILPGQTHNTILMRKAMSDGIDPAEVIAGVLKDEN